MAIKDAKYVRGLLDELLADDEFMTDGRRNDDTVNLLIYAELLDWPIEKTDEVVKSLTHASDYVAYEGHRDRILPYVSYWCKDGISVALTYTI